MHPDNVCFGISSVSSIIIEHICYIKKSAKIIGRKWKIWIQFNSS